MSNVVKGMWLVTGVAGYIGSAVAHQMQRDGFAVVGIDNMRTGRDRHIGFLGRSSFRVIDVRDTSTLQHALKEWSPIQGVIHCAGLKRPGESLLDPLEYFAVNAEGTRSLLEVCLAADVRNFVLSSSCSVYGNVTAPAIESTRLSPQSPYALSKLQSEQIVQVTAECFEDRLRAVSLRYFNVIGASASGSIDLSVTNLMPALARSVLTETPFVLNGRDYPTRDGSCLRDFVDIDDIADAHVRSARILSENGALPASINLGSADGATVLEIASMLEDVSGSQINIALGDSRAGDPAAIVASSQLAHDVLGWWPRRPLRHSIERAWNAYLQVDGLIDWNH